MAIGKIVFVGAGAIGGSVAAWTSEAHAETYVVDRPEVLAAIREAGIETYEGGREAETRKAARVRVLDAVPPLGAEDVLVFGVKNYSLAAAAASAAAAAGKAPLALSMANGIENQAILPRYFPRAAYCVVGYNAWLDAPGRIGYQSRGPLVLGTPDNSLAPELSDLAALMAKSFAASRCERLGDAVHSKLVVNLVNVVTTLVGHGYRPVGDLESLRRLVSGTLYEGLRVVEAAGFSEYHVGAMPGWSTIRAGALLPGFLTRGAFARNMAKMVRSSMSQDVFSRGASATELESITGYLVALAREKGMKTPFNSTLYAIAKEAFSKPGFEPLEPAYLLERVRAATS
jgi:2-dehydropantoate 2-reductase